MFVCCPFAVPIDLPLGVCDSISQCWKLFSWGITIGESIWKIPSFLQWRNQLKYQRRGSICLTLRRVSLIYCAISGRVPRRCPGFCRRLHLVFVHSLVNVLICQLQSSFECIFRTARPWTLDQVLMCTKEPLGFLSDKLISAQTRKRWANVLFSTIWAPDLVGSVLYSRR